MDFYELKFDSDHDYECLLSVINNCKTRNPDLPYTSKVGIGFLEAYVLDSRNHREKVMRLTSVEFSVLQMVAKNVDDWFLTESQKTLVHHINNINN